MNRFNKMVLKYHESIINIAGTATVCLVFASGVGRYRVVLFYGIYSFITFLLSLIKPGQKPAYIFLPVTIYALYLDITNGPFIPLIRSNSLIVAIGIMVLADTLARNFTENWIAKYTRGGLFIVCPTCYYDNKKLVEKCSECAYKKGDQPTTNVAHSIIFPNVKIPNKVVKMLNLSQNEDILFYISKFPALTVFIDGQRKVRIVLVVTTRNIFLLDYYRFNVRFTDGFREKDIIPLSDISTLEGKKQKIYLAQEPFLVISTNSGKKYELLFSKYGPYKERIEKIAAIIKKMNSHVEIKINFSEGV